VRYPLPGYSAPAPLATAAATNAANVVQPWAGGDEGEGVAVEILRRFRGLVLAPRGFFLCGVRVAGPDQGAVMLAIT